jgi:hypothetical protein
MKRSDIFIIWVAIACMALVVWLVIYFSTQ